MLNDKPDLLFPIGTPDGPLSVVLHPEAYATLAERAAANVPTETVGLLLGEERRTRDGERRLEVTEAVPLKLASSRSGLAPSVQEWEAVRSRLAEAAIPGISIIGWFYADPGIGIFGPRVDIEEVRRTLAPDLDLFLLVNPSTGQGAFYVWQDGGMGGMVPTGGFYEALPDHLAEPVIPWGGTVNGAARWLGSTASRPEAVSGETSSATVEHANDHGPWAGQRTTEVEPVPVYSSAPDDGVTDGEPWHLYGMSAFASRLRLFTRTQDWRRAVPGVGVLIGILLVALLAIWWFLQDDAGSAALSNFGTEAPNPTANSGASSLFASPTATSVRVGASGTPSNAKASGTAQALASSPTPSPPAFTSVSPIAILPGSSATPIATVGRPTSTPTPLARSTRPAPTARRTPLVPSITPPPATSTRTPSPTNVPPAPVPTNTPPPAPTETPMPLPTDTSVPVLTAQPTDTPATVPTDTQPPASTSSTPTAPVPPTAPPTNTTGLLPTLSVPLSTVALPIPLPPP